MLRSRECVTCFNYIRRNVICAFHITQVIDLIIFIIIIIIISRLSKPELLKVIELLNFAQVIGSAF